MHVRLFTEIIDSCTVDPGEAAAELHGDKVGRDDASRDHDVLVIKLNCAGELAGLQLKCFALCDSDADSSFPCSFELILSGAEDRDIAVDADITAVVVILIPVGKLGELDLAIRDGSYIVAGRHVVVKSEDDIRAGSGSEGFVSAHAVVEARAVIA